MRTILALILLASCQTGLAEDCWIPPKAPPCTPHLDGTLARAQAEHLRCIIWQSDASREEARQLRIALERCAELHKTDNWRFK